MCQLLFQWVEAPPRPPPSSARGSDAHKIQQTATWQFWQLKGPNKHHKSPQNHRSDHRKDPSTGCWAGYTLLSAPRTTMTLSLEDRNKDMVEFNKTKNLVSCTESISTPTTMILRNVWIRVFKFRTVSSINCIVLLHWVAKSTLIINMKMFALYPILGVSWLAQKENMITWLQSWEPKQLAKCQWLPYFDMSATMLMPFSHLRRQIIDAGFCLEGQMVF